MTDANAESPHLNAPGELEAGPPEAVRADSEHLPTTRLPYLTPVPELLIEEAPAPSVPVAPLAWAPSISPPAPAAAAPATLAPAVPPPTPPRAHASPPPPPTAYRPPLAPLTSPIARPAGPGPDMEGTTRYDLRDSAAPDKPSWLKALLKTTLPPPAATPGAYEAEAARRRWAAPCVAFALFFAAIALVTGLRGAPVEPALSPTVVAAMVLARAFLALGAGAFSYGLLRMAERLAK